VGMRFLACHDPPDLRMIDGEFQAQVIGSFT